VNDGLERVKRRCHDLISGCASESHWRN